MTNSYTGAASNRSTFLSATFELNDWADLEPYYSNLLEREISNVETLREWFFDRSELESVVSEDLAWRYIKMTCDTADEKLKERYTHFVQNVQPKIAPFSDKLNNKALGSPYLSEIRDDGFSILIRSLKKDAEIFREENIPIQVEISTESQKYGAISGAMTVLIDGEEMTLQQASSLIQSTDRQKRKKVYHAISERRAKDREELDELYTKLIGLRNQVAKNASFENFRDYMFNALGRFDYKPEDCFDFHQAVKEEIVPILDELSVKRKKELSLDELMPYDKSVDTSGKPPLEPFTSDDELLDKSITCFSQVDPYFGECLSTMKRMGHLDLKSRKGKAPGGYNYPLAKTGVPFIFMNATSTLRDMVTLMHEGGHAIHSFLTKELPLNAFKSTPSEVAELASMSMELISMDYWDVFFDNEDDLKRAKRNHLEQIIETLPWVAIIDKYQHWVYENPNHTTEERTKMWNAIFNDFSDKITSWEGLHEVKDALWQRQLHLYEVPFYYIEYGIAQLGAIAVWKNYKENNKAGLEGYVKALKLGYLKCIPDIYAAAGIEFNFSKDYISKLISFVKSELERLN